ncbi:ThiF family adenylyltransferase [Azohydromonas lata]|uniref:ThiF family adenylyltransferase n=1 Tax=Azohydromonas lata TaxID=45677 RepID=A0ABU5I892_9BURK|nr:ThiF family adenylyltransferase [Azohydromonas lata]MDZ5455321.1 ThiF family adenylyltransferase [Azohydromonas lata]
MTLTWTALRTILDTVGSQPAETGALLCGPERSDLIDVAHFDEHSHNTGASYSPAVEMLNPLLKRMNARGRRMRGFVHSHPPSLNRPSGADEAYAARILQAISDMPWMWIPIVVSAGDTGTFEMRAYVAERAGGSQRASVSQCRIVVTDMPSAADLANDLLWDFGRLDLAAGIGVDVVSIARRSADAKALAGARSSRGETFTRVEQAYDLPHLARCRVIAVGTGGGAGFVDDAARTGIGEWVLVDPDVVSLTNVATQQAYRRDVGRPKVEAMADRLRDIHPDTRVTALPLALEAVSDARMRDLALADLGHGTPLCTVLCGLTDSFAAQARVNRLALKLGLPSLCAQMYREGRAGEVTFTYPGVTPACHRCILSARYRHFVDLAGRNDVTSQGSPIFSAMRLNALAGWILMALLHHGRGHPRWGGLLQRIGDRNLVQVRMDPDLGSTLGLKGFDKASEGQPRHLFDDVLWQAQAPEAPPSHAIACPDCGGTGDLRLAKGLDGDTRRLPLSARFFNADVAASVLHEVI